MKYQITKIDKFLLIFLFILLIALITVVNNRRDIANKLHEYQIIECKENIDDILEITSDLFITYKENELESLKIEGTITYEDLTEEKIEEIKTMFEEITYNDEPGVITTYELEGDLLFANKTIVSKEYNGDYLEFSTVFDKSKSPTEMFEVLNDTENFECELKTVKK